jgi:hypothetical protein
LQISSIFKVGAIGERDVVMSEQQQLADIGSAKQPVISIAYEYLSWGTRCSTRSIALQYVKEANRTNPDLCLDASIKPRNCGVISFGQSSRFYDSKTVLQESLDRFVKQCGVAFDEVLIMELCEGFWSWAW